MSATSEQKFEKLRRAYEELRQEHDAALAALSQQQRSSGLDTSNVQTAYRDLGYSKPRTRNCGRRKRLAWRCCRRWSRRPVKPGPCSI